MATRTQTLVQLTDELVELLDRRAAARGISRSALIRELLEAGMRNDRPAEVARRIVEGYRQVPQEAAGDAWGDLTAWSEASARRNLAALGQEEEAGW